MSSTTLTYQNVNWINILQPTQQDMDELAARYPDFHPLNLKDCLTELEYPKLEHRDHYLFLVVQMPYWNAQERISRPAEVDIFITNNLLVTSHRGELKPMLEMFQQAADDPARRAEWMAEGASPLLYHLLNHLVDYCFPIVHKVSQNLRHIEENLFHEDTRHLLHEVAVLRRDIILLRGIFRSQQEILNQLIRGNWPFIQENLDPYWGDISDHLQQICANLDIDCEIISGLSDTLDTLASHRIDEVVRLLTVATVLTLPVTLLATIFGMNILMPFSNHPLLFFSIVLVGIGITLWLMWYLRKKGWL